MALLEVSELTKHFGGLAAVSNVSFALEEGQIISIIGPNGAGKTTTFNMIAGSIPATSGSVKFKGKELLGMSADQIAFCGITRTFQITAVFSGVSLFENVLIASHCDEKAGLLDTLFFTNIMPKPFY